MVILSRDETLTFIKFVHEYRKYLNELAFSRDDEGVLVINATFGNFKLFPNGKYYSFKDYTEHTEKVSEPVEDFKEDLSDEEGEEW